MHQGEQLKRWYKLSDMTADELAEKIGLSRAYLYDLFKKEKITEYYLQKLKAVGFDVNKNIQTNTNQDTSGIPVYDLRTTAGGVEAYGDQPELPELYVTVPGYEDCNYGLYVYGHSMHPTIENGALVLCRQVTDKSIIQYGEIYILVTAHYRMVKRLQKAEKKNMVVCVSDNPEKRTGSKNRYENFEVPLDKIKQLYIVKGIICKMQS